MSQDIVSQRVPHKHAEVIKAWADGCEIQWRNYTKGEDEWCNHQSYLPPPAWLESCEYRVKPEKVYPVTQMTTDEMSRAWCNPTPNSMGAAMEELANAALRHAIDAGQVVPMAEHEAALVVLGFQESSAIATLQRLGYTYEGGELWKPPLGLSPDQRATRELAIAKAVRDYITDGWPRSNLRYFSTYCESADLAAIIAGVRP